MPWYFYNREGYEVTPISPATVPTGALVLMPLSWGGTEPDGYLFCNGQWVDKNDYLDLFAEVGGLYGVTASQFQLPNFQEKFMRGIVTAAGGIGSGGGASTHYHILQGHSHNMGALHTHDMINHAHTIPAHTHDQLNHRHFAGTLTTNASTELYNNAIFRPLNPATRPPDQLSAAANHNHTGGLSGSTQNTGPGEANASGVSSAVSTDNFFPNGPGFKIAVSPASSPSANENTTVGNSLPSFIDMAVLVKT